MLESASGLKKPEQAVCLALEFARHYECGSWETPAAMVTLEGAPLPHAPPLRLDVGGRGDVCWRLAGSAAAGAPGRVTGEGGE